MSTTHTNPHELWDAYRDGALGDADRRAFERYLSDNADLADRYVEETRLLAALKSDDRLMDDAPDAAFREGVLDAWLTPKPVGFIRRHRASLAAAASIAVVAGLVWLAGRPAPAERAGEGPDRVVIRTPDDQPVIDQHQRGVAVNPDDTPRIDPVSQMVLSVSSTAEAPTRQLRQTIAMARSVLAGDPLLDLLERTKTEQTPAAPDDGVTPRS